MRGRAGAPAALRRALDALAFSSAWVAAAAATLSAAAARALGESIDARLVALAACGTFAVYTLDRLRDRARDRATAPARTRFVEAHAPALAVAAAGAAGLAIVLGLRAGAHVAGLAGLVLVFGLAHRRLKRRAWAKPVYLATSWTAVCVGIPAVAARDLAADRALLVAGIVGLTITANVALSNLRDGEGAAARLGRRRALALAAALCAGAAVLAALAPAPADALVWLPLATAATLPGFRPDERYGLLVVDGALLAGSLLALALA